MLLRTRVPSPPGNSNPPLLTRGVIAALVLSSFLCFLVLAAILFYIYIWRPRQRRSRHQSRPPRHVHLNQLHCTRRYSSRARGDIADPQEKDKLDSAVEQPFTGVVLDIGHDRNQPDDGENNDTDAVPDATSIIGVCGGRRDSSKSVSSGLERWKRGLSTLSGLAALGLNFRYSDEKSPVSDEGGDHGGCNAGLGVRVSRSLGRFGSNGKGKGRSSGSHDHSHDTESLSGLTSLSYASNIAAYVQPPSYAASISQKSQKSGSGSAASSPPQSPPSNIIRSPHSPDLGISLSQDVLKIPPMLVTERSSSQSIRLDRARMSGIHILGIGGSLSGVGSPISTHIALRGLSPRISKSRILDRGKAKSKGKARERKKEQKEGVMMERKRRGLPRPPSEQQASGSTAQDTLSLVPPTPIAMTGSPIRALPPIPTSQPTPGTLKSQPQSQLHPTPQPTPSQAKPREPPSSSYLSVPESSSFKLSFDQDLWVPGAPTPSSSLPSSNNNNERRFKPHPSLGSVAGLGFPRGIQSFAEAAALAANLTTRGILVEGRGVGSSGIGSVGEPSEDTARRLSAASRVHFEDDPTSLNLGEAKFRLTLPSGQQLLPDASDASSPSSAELNQGSSRTSEHVGTASFLDLSSQSSSLQSRQQSEATGVEFTTDIGTTADTRYEPESSRIWSMQLPGRRSMVAPQDLKPEWSDITVHTSHTRPGSSSSNSGHGSLRAQLSPVVPAPATVTDVGMSAPSSNRHIFPFPLAIPPSPYMPEGFTGVEPSPSLMSATTSIPVFNPSHPPPLLPSQRGDEQQLHVPINTSETTSKTTETSRQMMHVLNDNNERCETSPHPHEMAVNSPTDSFPHSISEVHFRTSVGADSDADFEAGRLQYARHYSVVHRHRHRHHQQHPPLPSMPLTPQRFNPQQEQSQSQSQQGSGGSSIVQKIFGGGSGGR